MGQILSSVKQKSSVTFKDEILHPKTGWMLSPPNHVQVCTYVSALVGIKQHCHDFQEPIPFYTSKLTLCVCYVCAHTDIHKI